MNSHGAWALFAQKHQRRELRSEVKPGIESAEPAVLHSALHAVSLDDASSNLRSQVRVLTTQLVDDEAVTERMVGRPALEGRR